MSIASTVTKPITEGSMLFNAVPHNPDLHAVVIAADIVPLRNPSAPP